MKRYSIIFLLLVVLLGACRPRPSMPATTAPTLTQLPSPTASPTVQPTTPPATQPPVTAFSPGEIVLDRGNPQRTGQYPGPVIRQLPDVIWQTDLGTTWLMPPLFADGIVYTGSGDGWLYAVDAHTGEKLWATTGFGQLETTGAIAGDQIIAGGFSQRVMALDRQTGEVRWSFNSRYVVQGSPLIIDNQVYIATDHALYALDLHTGQLLWETATGDTDAFMSGPAYEAGIIYTSGGKVLLALDSATGKELWRITQAMPFTGLAVANGLIYVGNFDTYLRAYDQHTGEELWKFKAEGVFWSAPAIRGQVVYAGNIDQFVYALNAQTGELLWSFKTAGQAVSEPVMVDDLIYVSDSSHEFPRGPRHLYALDALTGEALWTFEVVSTFLPAPTLGEDAIYVTSTNQILALK